MIDEESDFGARSWSISKMAISEKPAREKLLEALDVTRKSLREDILRSKILVERK